VSAAPGQLTLEGLHEVVAKVRELDRKVEAILGAARKQAGMARADEHADAEWKARVDEAIEDLAATGERFTAEDVRAIAGDPPDHPNAMGARFNAAARRRLIRKVGYQLSNRASLHRHPIAVWEGVA
jgi:hypothetical protein